MKMAVCFSCEEHVTSGFRLFQSTSQIIEQSECFMKIFNKHKIRISNSFPPREGRHMKLEEVRRPWALRKSGESKVVEVKGVMCWG